MVVVIDPSNGDTKSSVKCARSSCQGSGNMLKCSLDSCPNHFHVKCTKFNSDEEALNTELFFCNSSCKKRHIENFSGGTSTEVEPQSTIKLLKEKIGAQKATMIAMSNRFNELNEQRQKDCATFEERLEALEAENQRLRQLEKEVAELRMRSAQSESHASSKPTAPDNFHSCDDVEKKALETVFDGEDDEDFKRRLTEMFSGNLSKTSMPHMTKTVNFCKPNVESLSETQKLAYYQRLHVQRLEAPKLMKFEGEPAHWLGFKANYDRLKQKGEYDNEAMIEKLRDSLFGEAEKFVRQRLNQPYANADNILEVLERKFFQPKEAIAKALVKLENWHQIPERNRKELEAFLFEIDNYIFLCENLGFAPELEVAINSRITSKLPYNVETRWCSHVNDKKIKGTICDLSEFMWTFVPNLPVREVETAKCLTSQKNSARVNVVQPSDATKPFQSKKKKKNKPPCWYCKGDKLHYLSNCDEFKGLGFDEKAQFLSNNKICTRCLSSNQHAANNCHSTKVPKCSVQNCQNPNNHSALMHNQGSERNRFGGNQSGSSRSVMHVQHDVTTLFKIVPIFVIDGFGRKIETTLLMDRAAGASLVTKEFYNQLRINGEPSNLELMWLQPNATHNNSNAIQHSLTIAPRHDPNRLITLRGMYAIDNVSLPQQAQDPESLKQMYPYLRNAQVPEYGLQRPQILLGLPHARWMISLETVMDFANDSSPIAEKTPLGWTICGGLTPQRSIFHVCEVPECSHDTDVTSDNETFEKLHELVKHFNSFEMLGIKEDCKAFTCKNDERAIEIRNQTMRKVNNRYEIGLYWNNENCTLPDNYNTALRRLKSTEARLKQLGMVQWANEHQKLLRDLKFVREATTDDLSPSVPHKRVNYLIGFVTFNMNKQPPKPRWVVDAASTQSGISLNSVLLKGPDNLIPLSQALFHFRERKYATVCDATKMYHQILIRKEDQQVQRFLWRDCDNSKEPKIYIFESMVFGLSCAPSQANDVRIRHAEDSCDTYPDGSRVALNSMYMDDAFNSEDTEEEARNAAQQLVTMFKEISWDMVEFRSNSTHVLRQLPKGNVDNELLVDLGADDEVMARKVLGMVWDVKRDSFVFLMANNQELLSLSLHDNYHPTKKEVLSFVMKIFDCLGIISHFVIRGRMILQEIWRRGIGWNQHIPDDIHESWKRWLERFADIQKLEIPRHYGYDSRYSKQVTMHVFVDASLEAYAAIVFFRFVNDNFVHVAQVMAKCRVAPVKYASVPRLELMAALIGARIAKTVKKQHPRLKIESTTYWTDSVTVLRWLYAPHIRLQQFVAPRVSEIQEVTNVNEWRYVPTDLNVADDGTKWNDIDFSSSAQRWLKGPDFLYKDENDWPRKFPENVDLKEVPQVLTAAASEKMDENSAGVFESVSVHMRANWMMYRNIIGWVHRFRANLMARIRGKNPTTDKFLNAHELHEAENMIFKRIQKEIFKKELINLTRGDGVIQSSKLYGLNPFLDSDGLIRAKTRMYMEESIPYDMKCPPILPNKHETVHAFMSHLHVKSLHIGIEGTIAEARSRAWIIHARKAAKRVKHQCMYCIEIRARQHVPALAPLPSYRVNADSRPFEHVGADCCGPFKMYSGRSYHVREVCVVLFTCMKTRAVYLRKLDNLSADEMLLAIQDLWTRRGPICHIYSDNGRNFIGTANIIKDEHHKQLAEEKKITWHFSPALTPHWGGVWERLIKDVKRAMKAEMQNRILPEKVFECVLLQVEDIMNNRPLTHLPVSPDDYCPLTPNYLLKLHNGYAFMGSEAVPTDEESRYYTRRARIISERLTKKWMKEYLPVITKCQKTKVAGSGLKINDCVIYTDPTVKPAEWQRGFVINVYAGRDGIARVADIRLESGKILDRRSVQRLAKLEIDYESFGIEIKSKQNQKIIPQASGEKLRKKMQISEEQNEKLIIELGKLTFKSRGEVVKDSADRYCQNLSDMLQMDHYCDHANLRTIKIYRLPGSYSLYELISDFTKQNLWITRVVADSIQSIKGFFAYVTFDSEADTERALQLIDMEFVDRRCIITIPKANQQVFRRSVNEFGYIQWDRGNDKVQGILIVRRKDSSSKKNAITLLPDELWLKFNRLNARLNAYGDGADNPMPRVAPVIVVRTKPLEAIPSVTFTVGQKTTSNDGPQPAINPRPRLASVIVVQGGASTSGCHCLVGSTASKAALDSSSDDEHEEDGNWKRK